MKNSQSIRVIQNIALPMILFGTSSCSQFDEWQHPEYAACKKFTSGRVRSPSSFNEVSHSFKTTDENDIKKKKVIIEYDAANQCGTLVRNVQNCEFLIDENGKFKPDLEQAIGLSHLKAALGSSNTEPTEEERELGIKGGSDCCIAINSADPNYQNIGNAAEDMLSNPAGNGVSH
jgi:hypothetical protein